MNKGQLYTSPNISKIWAFFGIFGIGLSIEIFFSIIGTELSVKLSFSKFLRVWLLILVLLLIVAGS